MSNIISIILHVLNQLGGFPNNEETRSAYKTKKANNNNTISGLQELDGVLGPKFSEFGAKPGTKYKFKVITCKNIK